MCGKIAEMKKSILCGRWQGMLFGSVFGHVPGFASFLFTAIVGCQPVKKPRNL
jgi:hypothetical protein